MPRPASPAEMSPRNPVICVATHPGWSATAVTPRCRHAGSQLLKRWFASSFVWVLKPTLIIDYMKPHTDGRRDSDAALAETTVAKLLAADASRESKRGVLTVPGVEMGAPRGGSLVGDSFAGQI